MSSLFHSPCCWCFTGWKEKWIIHIDQIQSKVCNVSSKNNKIQMCGRIYCKDISLQNIMNITWSSSVFYSDLSIYKYSSKDKVIVFYSIILSIYIEKNEKKKKIITRHFQINADTVNQDSLILQFSASLLLWVRERQCNWLMIQIWMWSTIQIEEWEVSGEPY